MAWVEHLYLLLYLQFLYILKQTQRYLIESLEILWDTELISDNESVRQQCSLLYNKEVTALLDSHLYWVSEWIIGMMKFLEW
jgi:hypothetical protein